MIWKASKITQIGVRSEGGMTKNRSFSATKAQCGGGGLADTVVLTPSLVKRFLPLLALFGLFQTSALYSAANDAHIVIASEAGAKLDSDVTKGGGTDDTELIQSILDRAPKLGSLKLIVDGPVLVKGLQVHSNTIIECIGSGSGFFLADHADQPIIRNSDPSATERKNRNIAFLGGTYNGNSTKQAKLSITTKLAPGKNWPVGIAMYGVEQVTMRDLTVVDMTTIAVHFSNWRHVTCQNVFIHISDKPIPFNCGIQFQGPGQFLSMRNIHGNPGDDIIALNADDYHTDWNKNGEFGINDFFGPNVSYGPITDVDIDEVNVDGGHNGIRIMSRVSRIDRVSIRNVQGTFSKYGFFISPAWRPGGNLGNITFENIDLRPLEPDFGPLPFVFLIQGNIEQLTLRNIHSHLPVDSRPVVWVQPSSDIGVLRVDGMSFFQKDPRSAKTPAIQVDGHIDLLSVNNVTLSRSAEMPIEGSLVRTDPDRTKLKQYYKIGRSVLNCLYPWAVNGRGWPEAFESLERRPQIHRLHLSNITANRLKSVLQHDLGDIGHLQLDNIMTTDVPSPIAVGGEAKIGEISSTNKSEK